MMTFYTMDDLRASRRALTKSVLLWLALLLPLLALYVFMLKLGSWPLMLLVLLAAFVCTVLMLDLLLLPHLRYLQFLRDVQTGLRHELFCALETLSEIEETKDGIQIRRLQARDEAGESHILYWDSKKLDLLPAMDSRVRLESFGRHVVGRKEC